MLFDVKSAQIHPKIVVPIEQQEQEESQRRWSNVTSALLKKDIDTATAEKNKIEDEQRNNAKERMADGVDWQPRFFRYDEKRDEWHLTMYVPVISRD